LNLHSCFTAYSNCTLGLVHFLHQNHEPLHTMIALTIKYFQHEQAIIAARNHSNKQSQQKASTVGSNK
jgi:hypothetical protein